MRRLPLILFPVVLCAMACAKEEEPLLQATFHATCRDCVVSYAVGPAQAKVDTLLGVAVPGTTDTLPETAQWEVELKEGDNLFLRACRIRTDTAFGEISLKVDGGVRTMEASADTSLECASINAPGVAR